MLENNILSFISLLASFSSPAFLFEVPIEISSTYFQVNAFGTKASGYVH